ncbi:nitrate- and nitrite sensing domain-containing protein [Actinoplanes sp. NPDC020271]|uniref:sensor histidine kinase n=1 Tax=Actinoplanes sp. NPDC020271 TaxID=3363896 RepID=UPI0037AE9739
MNTRTKVITGLALLVALWAAAAVPALAGARRVTSARTTATDLFGPAGALVLALETERRIAVAGHSASETAAQRVHTDHARQELSTARGAVSSWLSASDATRQADALLDRTARLPEVRAQADGGQLSGVRTADAYTALIDPAGLETPTVFADQVGSRAAALSALSRARELLAEEDALLAAFAAQDKIKDADRVRLQNLAGARRELLSAAGAELPIAVSENLTASEQATGGTAWSTAYNAANTALWAQQTSGVKAAADAGTSGAVVTAVRAGVVGGVGLIAVIAMLLLAWRSGTGPARPRREKAPARGPARDSGLEPLLRDLEKRNQGLVQRQLRLLDALARREADQDALGDLFRADHLANRMRRNLEKAITLAGGTPARGWDQPVPFSEVVRAAAAEISEYERVSTARVEPVTLAGPAVTDVVHLLAELAENAATFAPAETPVQVSGEYVPDGYRITVTDAGPGMTADDLATAARVMSEPDPPAGGTWWGLYATGRFAARHGITVALSNGFGGGLVAEVLVPSSLIGAVTSDNDTTLDDLAPVIG